jgi:hypothetical protein
MTSREIPEEQPVHHSEILDRALTPEEKSLGEYANDVGNLVDSSIDLISELRSSPINPIENRHSYTFSGSELNGVEVPDYVNILLIDHTLDEVIIDYDKEANDTPVISLTYVLIKNDQRHFFSVTRPRVERSGAEGEEFHFPNGERLILPKIQDQHLYQAITSHMAPHIEHPDTEKLALQGHYIHNPLSYTDVSLLLEDRATTSSIEAAYDCTEGVQVPPLRIDYVVQDAKPVSIMVRVVTEINEDNYDKSESINVELTFGKGIGIIFSNGVLDGSIDDQEFEPQHRNFQQMIQVIRENITDLNPIDPELIAYTDAISDQETSL